MEDFLYKLQISENAVKIYIECIGELPLTREEIGLIIPELNEQQFADALKELINIGVLVPIPPNNPKLLTHYLTIAPFKAMSKYYQNINNNMGTIQTQIGGILEKTLDDIFNETELIELDSIDTAVQELRKDIEEDTIIQRQDVEDIAEGMENLRVLSDALEDLHNKIKGLTQSEFSNLIKILPKIENKLKEIVETKKNKRELIEFIESIFKENFDKMVNEFTINLHELIKNEFENTLESMNTILNSTFQFRDDFKMLLLNMIHNFELKMNSIMDIIKNKNDALGEQKQQFKNIILEDLNKLNEDSINSIVALNDPINQVILNYLNIIKSSEKSNITHIYQVYSLTKVKSEIETFINNAQSEIKIIIPVIENLILPDQFKGISKSLKIKLASSEAHTNSAVKSFKELANLEYRTLKNSSVIALKGDEDRLLIGVIETSSKNRLKDFVGLTTDFSPLVKLLEPVITSLWQIGSTDTAQVQKSGRIEESLKIVSEHLKPQTTPKEEQQLVSQKIPKVEKLTQQPQIIKENKTAMSLEKEEKETTLKLQKKVPATEVPITKEKVSHPTSEIQPQSGDSDGIMINDAFNTLIQKLHSLKGTEFSERMQRVADLILEKKGFSVTLHKVRSIINQFKSKNELLNELDVKQIVASIDDWKSHLL
ncbi:MAG: hypothetical protein EU533_01600 [Promethearchaeota archaeon]|nr:MAG: hypothetical protein EU533_01600 [Candidatus Lokiarchaeota archaeon]